MEEKTLIYLSLAVALVGIALMFFANKLFQPELVNVSDITTDLDFVRIQGKIVSVTVSKSETVFIKLKDSTGTIDLVAFKGTLDPSMLSEGMTIEVLGKPDIYKGKLEVIVSNIQVLSSERV